MSRGDWATMSGAAKRRHVLDTGHQVFAREGVEASMPSVAAAAGIGVATVYRVFPSKPALLSALVVERLAEVEAATAAALAGPDDPWTALVAVLWRFGELQARDDVVAEAITTVAVDPTVAAARERTNRSFAALLEAAKAQGRLREDAAVDDVRLILAGGRAAERLEPGAWRRMIELGIDALDRLRR